MSVVEPERRGNRLLVHIEAQELAAYTSEILSNPKHFNPEIDEDLIKEIKQTARDIYKKLWAANRWRADGTKTERLYRRGLQEEGIGLCDEMHALIGIAKKVFHVSTRRMKCWSNKITSVRTLAQKWKESDIKRFGNIYATA